MPIQRPGQYSPADALAQEALEDPKAPEEKPSEKKTPMERWREAIAEVELSEEDADKILDSVLANGFHEKSYKIFRGKLTVALRSRDSAAIQRVSDALDSVRTNDPRVHTQTMNRFNLAASLTRYQDKAFKHAAANADPGDRDKAFYERLAFVDTIPAPVIVQLYAVLDKFDRITFAALSEGAQLGF